MPTASSRATAHRRRWPARRSNGRRRSTSASASAWSALVAWQGSAPRYAGATVYAPLTLRVADTLLLHVNVGRDWLRDLPSRGRAGVSLEWQVVPEWTIIGERYRQYGSDFARLGVQWQQSPSLGFDLSRARGVGATSAGIWTLGATWTFDAPLATRR